MSRQHAHDGAPLCLRMRATACTDTGTELRGRGHRQRPHGECGGCVVDGSHWLAGQWVSFDDCFDSVWHCADVGWVALTVSSSNKSLVGLGTE